MRISHDIIALGRSTTARLYLELGWVDPSSPASRVRVKYASKIKGVEVAVTVCNRCHTSRQALAARLP
jgi:hypothetical protein